MNPASVRLIIMTLAGSLSDRAKASRADVVHPSMARQNRAEVVGAGEIGVYHWVQRVVRRAFLGGVDSFLGKSYGHRSVAGTVETALMSPPPSIP